MAGIDVVRGVSAGAQFNSCITGLLYRAILIDQTQEVTISPNRGPAVGFIISISKLQMINSPCLEAGKVHGPLAQRDTHISMANNLKLY